MTAEPVTTVRAAGAVTLRNDRAGTLEVLLVHRPRYDDWSLPKGTLDDNELAPAAAMREVAEETGQRIRLLAPLDQVRYPLPATATHHPAGTEKVVAWWHAVLAADDAAGGADDEVIGGDPAGDEPTGQDAASSVVEPEVDQVVWCDLDKARRLLSYDLDRAVLDQAIQQPTTTPVILVRHAKAVNRKDWTAADADRPLRPRGRTQARGLAPLLDAYGVSELITSGWQRCIGTLQPYAVQAQIQPRIIDVFNEDLGKQDPSAAEQAMAQLAEQAVVDHRPVAVCGHRPVIPEMLEALDIPARALATAECVVAHLSDTGALHAVEWHRPRA